MDNCRTADHSSQAPDARRWSHLLARYRDPSNSRSIVELAITLGPLTALCLLGIPAYLLHDGDWAREPYERYVIVHDVMWVNVGWSIVNLLPILPLDGGNIAASLFGRRTARFMSMVVAFGAAIGFAETNQRRRQIRRRARHAAEGEARAEAPKRLLP